MQSGKQSLRRLAVLGCVLLLVLSALPLYAISFYNHPYYDDYGFSAGVHQVWLETGSFGAVLRQALSSARETRLGWQGTYTGTLLSNVQPGVFSEGLYWIGTFFLLTAFLLSGWFFLATVFGKNGLGLERWQLTVLCCLVLSLLLQLMPDSGEAWYWFNGGVGNVFIYSLMLLFTALAVRMWRTRCTGKRLLLMAALVPVAVLLGGGSYGGGLMSLCALALALVWAGMRRQKQGLYLALPAAVLLGCFLYSIAAPGNAQRAALIGAQVSPVKAVLQSLYYGAALMGEYLSLPLMAVTGLLVPFFWQAARKSRWQFRCPLAVAAGLGGLYCTQLTPPLYSGVFLGGGRIMNTYFISFCVMWLLFSFYLTGWACRRLTAPDTAPAPLRRGLALFFAALLALGLLGYHPDGAEYYGLRNLSGVSAGLSLLSGEAAQYDLEMEAREALLNDQTQPVVTLQPLTAVPDVFMDDLLVRDAQYDVRPALCGYYQKDEIIIGEEP